MKKQERSVRQVIINGICLFLVIGMAACSNEKTTATEENDMAATETEASETWDNNRFSTNFTSNNRYKEWDANGDTYLDENEYQRGFYRTWDTNRDNRVDQNEWNTASRDYGMEGQNWTDWDSNKDSYLDEKEYNTNFNKSGWYSSWDKDSDKRVSEREYTDGLFGQWDRNKDNSLDENEYRPYNTYYGDGTGTNGAGTGATGTGTDATGTGTDATGTGTDANKPNKQ